MDVSRSGTRICFSHTAALLDSRSSRPRPNLRRDRHLRVAFRPVHSHNDVNTLRNKVQAGRAIAREKTREMMLDAQTLSHMQPSPPFNTATIYLL
jgi:hypothetical protein